MLIGAISFVGYNFFKKIKQPIANVYDAVPLNASLILSSSSFKSLAKKLNSTNIIWEELVNHTATISQLNNQLNYFDSITTLPNIKKHLSNQPLVFSVHLAGANNYDYVGYVGLKNIKDETSIANTLKNISKSNFTNRLYENVNIYSQTTTTKKKFSYIYINSTFIFSYSTLLLEDVIRQVKSEEKLINDKKFETVFNTAGADAEVNIFINQNIFSKLLSQCCNKTTKPKVIEMLSNYSSWTELDMSIKSNTISLNGFTYATDSSKHYLSLFKNQKPQNIEITDILPNNTAFLLFHGFSHFKQYLVDRKDILKSKNSHFKYQQLVDQYLSEYNIDIEEELLATISNELTFFITEPFSNEYAKNSFIAFSTNNIDKTNELFIGINNKTNFQTKEIEYREYTIRNLNINNSLGKLLGDVFLNINTPYYTFINNYVIIGNSENSLKEIINDYEYKNTLGNNENYLAFSEQLKSESNIFVYNNIARSVNLYKHFAKNNIAGTLDDKIDVFRKFEAVAYQVSKDKKNLFYNNIYFKYNPVYKKDTRTLWETKLDTTISQQPYIVLNHTNQTKEIFVQDDANTIYLISSTGKVLWKKSLDGKIMGTPTQIDVYKNNKLQLLFNTKNTIYLLDRNGNSVENFPVNLTSTATNNISVLDYDNNKNYRLLIGCNNNMVYNFDATGNKVEGWDYTATQSAANGKIWHINFNGKDYIIIPTENGSVKIVERAGKDRLVINNVLPKNLKVNFVKSTTLSKSYLITCDSLGIITRLYLNDILNKESIKNDNTKFFEIAKTSNRYCYYYGSDKKLIGANTDNKTFFEYESDNKIKLAPLLFKINNTYKVGAVLENKQIVLINDNGEMHKGFPLTGSTIFSIGDLNNDRTTNLVVADNKFIYTYNIED